MITVGLIGQEGLREKLEENGDIKVVLTLTALPRASA